jgi:hypothetical protein
VANGDEQNVDTSLWPLHVKAVPRIKVDALNALSSSSAVSKDKWLRASGWLHDPARYAAVPIKPASGAPAACMSDDHIAKLGEFGVVTPCRRGEVSGWVKMFPVLEFAKQRWRPIKHTFVVNEALGKDSLEPCPLPSKSDICKLVRAGDVLIQLDFASYFDQFVYSEEVSRRFCFRHKGEFFRLCTLAMGQRQAVEVAMSATELMLDFEKTSKALAYIDNVIFVGSRDEVLRDATEFVRRCKLVGALLNEDVDDLQKYVKSTDDWCGVSLDMSAKTVRLTSKVLKKLAVSWKYRSIWTWRSFAAHIGLLFWAWGIIDLPMADYFEVLRFVSQSSQHLQAADENEWQKPAAVWPSVWPPLQAWTELALQNLPRTVPEHHAPEWLMEVDASRWGWGYFAVNDATGEVRMHGEPWSRQMEFRFGNKLRRSTFAEPHGIHNALCHLLSARGPHRVRLGTDSTVARASFERGFNSHSYDINEVLRKNREVFGAAFDIELLHVAGVTNVADSLSRGGRPLTPDEIIAATKCLRRSLGSGV